MIIIGVLASYTWWDFPHILSSSKVRHSYSPINYYAWHPYWVLTQVNSNTQLLKFYVQTIFFFFVVFSDTNLLRWKLFCPSKFQLFMLHPKFTQWQYYIFLHLVFWQKYAYSASILKQISYEYRWKYSTLLNLKNGSTFKL